MLRLWRNVPGATPLIQGTALQNLHAVYNNYHVIHVTDDRELILENGEKVGDYTTGELINHTREYFLNPRQKWTIIAFLAMHPPELVAHMEGTREAAVEECCKHLKGYLKDLQPPGEPGDEDEDIADVVDHVVTKLLQYSNQCDVGMKYYLIPTHSKS